MQCTKYISFNISLFFFFPGTQSSKDHKTFLRKEAVDARVQESVWIWISECFPKKFLLFPCVVMGLIPWLLFYVGLVSVRWTCCPYLWKAIPYHLYCPGFCPQGLEKFDWLGGDISEWKCWPLCLNWLNLQSLGDIFWKLLYLECDLEMASVASFRSMQNHDEESLVVMSTP